MPRGDHHIPAGPTRKLACCGLAVLCCATAAVSAGGTVRVALPPVGDSRSVPAGDEVTAAVALYLRERIAECPGVRAITDQRAAAILNELTSGVRAVDDDDLLAAFSSYVPVDAVVRTAFAEDTVTLTLHRAAGTTRLVYPDATARTCQTLVHRLAGDVANALELPAPDRGILIEKRIPSPAAFHAYYYTQTVSARWPNNPGEARLRVLQPVFRENPQSIGLAARIVADAAYLFEAGNRVQDFADAAATIAALALPAVLGTEHEWAAHAVAKLKPEAFESDLLAIAKPVVAEEAENIFDDVLGAEDGDLGDTRLDVPVAAMDRVANATREQRLGAVRLLGVMGSGPGLPLILAAATHTSAEVRAAGADALQYTAAGHEVLLKLTGDDDPMVAFAAAHSLWRRGTQTVDLLRLARLRAGAGSRSDVRRAAAVLAAQGTVDDMPRLRELSRSADGVTRRDAVDGLLRLGALSASELADLLDAPDEATIAAVLAHADAGWDDRLVQKCHALANDPCASVTVAARRALAMSAPRDGVARAVFELEIEHPYIRRQIIDRLARSGSELDVGTLEKACGNRDPQTRAYAMRCLAALAPQRCRPFLFAALRDPYGWVRLHAAALVGEVAVADDAAALQAALTRESDPAARAYLQHALSKATGQVLPSPAAAARSVRDSKMLTWLCGLDSDAAHSPFTAYYVLNVKVDDVWRASYESGKVFFGRAAPVSNPGLIVTDPVWRDRFWLSLNAEVPPENLPYIDGLVFGEETMKFSPDALWETGWRLFCRDAGIDPERVAGQQDHLSDSERGAWQHWGQERCIDGFNILYDYTKLRLAKLRPGLQVATFVPGETSGITPADRRWKFDVAGLYDYKGCNRIAAYTMTRRIQTLWPERPVIWLSLGIGGYEMNPVKHSLKTPQHPMFSRANRAYADTISAWLAGADPGWFSTWIFVEHDFKGSMWQLHGVQIKLGDIFADTERVRQGIDYAFRDVDALYDLQATKQPKAGGVEREDDDLAGFVLDEPEPEEDPIRQRIDQEKARMFDGFQFYGKYVYDCGRVFSDLPRVRHSSQALLVRPNISVWTRGGSYPMIPGFALVSSFDFLCDINKAPDLELAKYRFIALHDPGLLRDRTIAALTTWLREVPGLLYVHRYVSPNNGAEAPTAADHDGTLANDWPWEAMVAPSRIPEPAKPGPLKLVVQPPADRAGSGGSTDMEFAAASICTTFACTGDAATPLALRDDDPVLVLWRHPDFKGAVLFDGIEHCSGDYLGFLGRTIAALHGTHDIGLGLRPPWLHQALTVDGVTASATSPYYRDARVATALPGVDLLTGEANPVVGPNRSGALVAAELTGRFVASHAGVVVLADQPFEVAEQLPEGLAVRSAGLMRAGTASGAASATVEKGQLPPVVDVTQWLLYGTAPGATEIPIDSDSDRGSALFVRSADTVVFRHAPGGHEADAAGHSVP